MKRLLTLTFLILSCGQAGSIEQSSLAPSISSNELVLNGRVAIGAPVQNADISVSLFENNTFSSLATTQTDEDGQFQISLDLYASSDADILITASQGQYVDALSQVVVSFKSEILQSAWKAHDLANTPDVVVSPMTTLHAAFYNCLQSSSSTVYDPLDYATATFSTVFGINLKEPTDDEILPIFDFGFSMMANEKRAESALALVSLFASHLETQCDLLGPIDQKSSYYSFHSESFRDDFLNAVASLDSEITLQEITESIDLDEIVASIRQLSNILFEFRSYE